MNESGDINVTRHETIDERLLNRVIFFTDAVFAIVVTLMILDLKPPPFQSPLGNAEAMKGMASHFLALVLSFFVISVFWIAHLSTTRRLRHFDWASTVANLVFIFPVCLIPFATEWWGRDISSLFPWGMYCGTMIMCSLANVVLVLTVSRGGGRLLGGVTNREKFYRAARAASPGVAFGVGLVLLGAGLLWSSRFSGFLIPIQILILDWTIKPRTEAKPA
jgi:uncharacterized membrane protein